MLVPVDIFNIVMCLCHDNVINVCCVNEVFNQHSYQISLKPLLIKKLAKRDIL